MYVRINYAIYIYMQIMVIIKVFSWKTVIYCIVSMQITLTFHPDVDILIVHIFGDQFADKVL